MLTPAELAAMPRTTPTALAEASYAARGRPTADARGPLIAPPLRGVFRPTLDGSLLRRIGDAAVDAFERRKLPAADVAAMAAALSADLLERFPADEMAILEKWGFAWSRETVWVRLSSDARYSARLPVGLVIPKAASTDYSAEVTEHAFPVPPVTTHFFALADEAAVARAAVKSRLLSWPTQFKRNEGRQPRWEEIAADWPLIAACFVAAQS
jgi:hypothetical protein